MKEVLRRIRCSKKRMTAAILSMALVLSFFPVSGNVTKVDAKTVKTKGYTLSKKAGTYKKR